MKHRIRNILITLISYSGLISWYQHRALKKGALVRVIAFHDVADQQWFASVIAQLCKQFNVISPSEFEQKKFVTHKINVLITFDDGYASWRSHVLPVLDQYNIKGLFFCNSGLLSVADDPDAAAVFCREQLLISPKEILSWSDARALVEDGQVIGGHTVNHHSLTSLDDQTLKQEIEEDRGAFAVQLGAVPTHFAYPFGTKSDFSSKVESIVRKAGYRYVYTARPGWVYDTEHHIPRTLIENNQAPSSVCRWITGAYDMLVCVRR